MQTTKPLNQIDQLLKDGLCPDIQKINWYRQVLQNPQGSFNNTIYRNIAGEVFDKLLNYVLNDSILFNRLRQDLLADHLNKRAFENIQRKAIENGIQFDVLLEVYNRGLQQDEPVHLTQEQRAFNRVNSFVSHGRAWYEDYDLVEMQLNPDKRLEATKSLSDTYKDDTPGERKTLSTIRRARKNG